jgi:hypothetical protein
LSFDTLASRAKIAVIVPATNTVVQPEMEAMRPAVAGHGHAHGALGDGQEGHWHGTGTATATGSDMFYT